LRYAVSTRSGVAGPQELLLPHAVSASLSKDELFMSVPERRADDGGRGHRRGGRCEATAGASPPRREAD
jgi:hypothetical protein